MERQFKYIYAGNEVSKEEFTNVTKEMFKWFENNTINAVDYSSVSDFLNGGYKSKGEINKHLKGVLDGLDSQKWSISKPENCLENKMKKFYPLNLPDWKKEHAQLIKECLVNLPKGDKEQQEMYLKGQTLPELKRILPLFKNGHSITFTKPVKNTDKMGEKYNKHKLPMSKLFLQFPDALQAVVLASCYGHHCYPSDTDWLNFKRVEGGSQNYKDAEIRHFLGGEKDKESNLPEIFHQAWNKLAELQLWLEENNMNIKDFSKNYLENLQNQK